jgi:hypothetical protein
MKMHVISFLAWTLHAVTQSVSAQDVPTFPVTSTFDVDHDGWTTPSVAVEWLADNSNPGGFLYHNDVPGGTSSGFAPAKFLGDWSSLDEQGLLLYDHKVISTGAFRARSPYRVRISGPNAAATWTGPQPSTDSYGDWITLRIPIKQSSWQLTSGTWEALLSNVTALEIQIEQFDNYNFSWRDQNAIDNVILTKTPPQTPPAATISFQPVVSFLAELGNQYIIEASDDMQTYIPPHAVVGKGSYFQYTDKRTIEKRQFYRIRIQN